MRGERDDFDVGQERGQGFGVLRCLAREQDIGGTALDAQQSCRMRSARAAANAR
jgi:hypothetical protein